MGATTVTVSGMNCGHCATSVREEIGDIPGVHAVEVDLASGNVTIDSDSTVDGAAIRNAIEDAGYRLAC
jgi:copper chaperone